MNELGSRIRQLRKEKKITLVELSNITKVAQASLSRIETGIMKGTVESHKKIAEALGMSLAELYKGLDSKLSEIEVKTHGQISSEAVIKQNNVRLELLVSQLGIRKFAPVLITLPSAESLSFEKLERETDKFFWIQSGKCELSLQENNYTLEANDTIYFDASFAHILKNTGPGEARIFSITSPASF